MKRSARPKQKSRRTQAQEPKEVAIDKLEDARERLRSATRAAMGFSGDASTNSLREDIGSSGAGWYPLTALGLLVMVDQFQGYALRVLGPEVSRALGMSRPAFAGVTVLTGLASTLAVLPFAALVQNRPRRALVSVATAIIWSITTILTGFVTGLAGLMAVLLADGVSTGSVQVVHQPLLIDSYPPNIRVRILSFYRGMDRVGNIAAPLLLALLTSIIGFTWRGVFLVMGLVSLLVSISAARLKDPGFGYWDTARARAVIREHGGRGAPDERVSDPEVTLGFFEIARRLVMVPTVRRMLIAWAVFGVLVIPLNTYLFFFLDERWGMGPGARGLFFAGLATFSVIGLRISARRADAILRGKFPQMPKTASWLLALGIVALAVGIYSPNFALMAGLLGIAFAMFAILSPLLSATMLSIIPARMRPHASALAGIFLGMGAFGGILLLQGVDRRLGTTGAIASIAVPGLIAAAVFYSASRTVDGDLNRMVDDMVEQEEIQALKAKGSPLPLLSCRRIDFSYGQVQVLFNVDLSMEQGEIVALLGTNGAGKSTLLRVISGLELPQRGTVRYSGQDVTYVDAERRVALGICQVPGGRAVFPNLSVVENLRLFGFGIRGNGREIGSGIEAIFEAFPVLADRHNQKASTLSGGEQQMLGLASALMQRPRLLLIDELSLGLAPKVVSQLLEMVRLINSRGTAVLLVEQSVNVALSLVDHVYFMEKGEIRFDGTARGLLKRPDLLRSIFLKGASGNRAK